MKKNVVTKDNKLINASYSLNLVEQRLILLAIANSRLTGNGITSNNYLKIHAHDYISTFGVDRSSTYKSMKENSKRLFKREFSFTNGKFLVLSRWVSSIRYDDDEGIVSLIFSPEIIPFISELEKNFTSYQLSDIANLSSEYAVRLYELLICWKTVGETPIFDIESFRLRLGVDVGEYTTMSNFKARVLDIGIKQINEYSNIFVIAIQHKKGRVISGFSFAFKVLDEKPKRKKITKKQAEGMANVGESYKDLYSRLSKEYLILE
jgi:plasmid replication initiation protein